MPAVVLVEADQFDVAHLKQAWSDRHDLLECQPAFVGQGSDVGWHQTLGYEITALDKPGYDWFEAQAYFGDHIQRICCPLDYIHLFQTVDGNSHLCANAPLDMCLVF